MKQHSIFAVSLLSLISWVNQPVFASEATDTSPSETIQLEHKNPLEPALIKVQNIAIIGTQHQDAIRLLMHLHPGDEATPEEVRADMQRIGHLGYFSDITPRLLKVNGGYELIIYVRENPQLENVVLLNEPEQVLTHAEITEAFADLKGQMLNMGTVQQILETLEQRYREAGYVLAKFEIVPSESGLWVDSSGNLSLRINEGRIHNFVIAGNSKTEEQVILRELSLKPGELFQAKVFQQDLQRLYNLGFFENIEILPKPAKETGEYEIVLQITEEKTADTGLNFSLNNRDGVLGGLHLTDTNFLGKGQYLNLNFQTSLNFLDLFSQNPDSHNSFYGRVDFVEPWLLADRTSLGGSVFTERTPIFYGQALDNLPVEASNGILQTRTGASLNMSRPLFGDSYSPWKGQLALTAEQVGLSDFQQQPLRELSLSNRFSATDVFFNLGGTLSYDSRDIALNPHSGIYGSVSAKPVWGDGSYLKLSGNVSTYIPILEQLTLALGVQGGTFLGQQPIYEQFLGAGYSAIRGWNENGSLFGSQYVLGSLEARFPIYDFISGVVFSDFGNFAQETSALSLETLKYGVGAGVRVQTPMGLLRLDYGIRDFQALTSGAFLEAGQLHFSIGQKF